MEYLHFYESVLARFVTLAFLSVNVCLSFWLVSVKEDGKSVPTRLSIAAADCILAITKVLAVGTNSEPEDNPTESIDTGHQRKPLITPIETIPNDVRNAHVAPDDVNNTPSTSSRDLFCTSERRNMALWEQLDNLVSLVNVLCEVSMFAIFSLHKSIILSWVWHRWTWVLESLIERSFELSDQFWRRFTFGAGLWSYTRLATFWCVFAREELSMM